MGKVNSVRMLVMTSRFFSERLSASHGVVGWPGNPAHGVKALVRCLLAVILASAVCVPASAMTEISDNELSGITGQALMQMGKTPGAGISSDITFYKAGLDVELELNLNIAKLQLGCGGVNGPGCDIDMDNVSLSGNSWGAGRPESSAVLTRPFFEFAVKNDGQKTLREVVGIRLSAEQAEGMLTIGTENTGTPNGINSLSGYLELASASGTGMTAQRNMTYPDTGMLLSGRVNINYYLFTGMSNFTSDNYTIQVNPAVASFTTAPVVLSGKRMTTAELSAVATVADIGIQCPPGMQNACLVADVDALWGLTLSEGVVGTIRGVKAAVSFSENLGFIHKINVNNPFSLSMQTQNVLWPGAAATAETGWWMAFEDPIDIGDISTSNPIQITNDVLRQLVAPINQVLYDNPPTCAALSCLTGTTLNVGVVDLTTYFSNPANYLDMPLVDQQLSAQSFTPNCWGSAKFC